MKNLLTVKMFGDVAPEALRVLRSVRAFEVEIAKNNAGDSTVDAFIRTADQEFPLAVEFKSRVNAAAARQLVALANQEGTTLLVVARTTTAAARQLMQEEGVAFADSAENVHLELPGILIHLTGRPRSESSDTAKPRLSGKAGVVAQALLLDRSRQWGVTELAETAHVSTGLAHRVLVRLEAENLVTVQGVGPKRTRILNDPSGLLDLWVEEQRDRPHRTTAHVLATSSREVAVALRRALEQLDVGYAFTGAAAADLVAPLLTALPVVEVWLAAAEDPVDVGRGTNARIVSTGHNVVFLQDDEDGPLAFKQRVQDQWIVNPLRLYFDLLQSPQRGKEQADTVRTEVIRF